jgi:hypothetical protein
MDEDQQQGTLPDASSPAARRHGHTTSVANPFHPHAAFGPSASSAFTSEFSSEFD